MEEIWKDIEGYEGLYQISNTGNVRKINRDYRSPKYHEIKKSANNNSHYYKVCLSRNGSAKNHLVHRLVAKAFLPNPYKKPVVNHIDGNKLNNSVKNLEWVTVKENAIHAVKMGLMDEVIKRNGRKVEQFDCNHILLKTWNSFHEIERETGMLATLICRKCRNGNHKAYGFYWGYANE